VLLVSGYASINHGLPSALRLRLGSENSEAMVVGEGGHVGNVELGRLSTVVKPVAIPVQAPPSHVASTYQVQNGDTVKSLAARFGVSANDIRWSNLAALKSLSRDVVPGQKILIPPTDGIVVVAKNGDTALSLANAFGVDSQAIVDFNYLRASDQEPIPAGTTLVIPRGKGPNLTAPAVTLPSIVSYTGANYSVAPFTGTYHVAAGNRFPYGYCTWYVYNRRPVPWLGNAWEWAGQAQAAGWATGPTPKVGAIMVTRESSFGHVAYVEAVNADGSWTVSEMNFEAFGVADMRTIKPGGVPLITFIY
jgi:surface antigen